MLIVTLLGLIFILLIHYIISSFSGRVVPYFDVEVNGIYNYLNTPGYGEGIKNLMETSRAHLVVRYEVESLVSVMDKVDLKETDRLDKTLIIFSPPSLPNFISLRFPKFYGFVLEDLGKEGVMVENIRGKRRLIKRELIEGVIVKII